MPPNSSVVAAVSLGSWIFANLVLGKTPKAGMKKWEKKFGKGTNTTMLIKDLSLAYGALAQASFLLDSPQKKIFFSIKTMYDLATATNDPVSICYACGWLSTGFSIVGQLKAAMKFSQIAADLAELHPIDGCIAPASYCKLFLFGHSGKIQDAYFEAKKSEASFSELGDLRKARECEG
jgi:hypothetical protein